MGRRDGAAHTVKTWTPHLPGVGVHENGGVRLGRC
jgi:hypothetical protein